MRIIDTHVHLSDIEDLDRVLSRAKQVGISAILAVGTNIETSSRALDIAEKNLEYVYPAIGIHPSEFYKENLDAAYAFISNKAASCTAIGEIGLDYWVKPIRKNKTLREQQQEVFKRQLELAKEFKKPVSIHSRGAWRDCLDLVTPYELSMVIFHWYSGPLDVLKDILDQGFYVSCTPALNGSPELRSAMDKAPLDRILVETDSPVYIRGEGRASEPADATLTVKELAYLKGLPLEDVAKATTLNALKVFDIRTGLI